MALVLAAEPAEPDCSVVAIGGVRSPGVLTTGCRQSGIGAVIGKLGGLERECRAGLGVRVRVRVRVRIRVGDAAYFGSLGRERREAWIRQ
jgi:hypothetical protein